MSDWILIKSGALGNRDKMPTLRYDSERGGEIAYRTDEKALYIGTGQGNEKVGDVNWEARIKSLEDEILALRGYIDGLVAEMNARLDALTPSEEEGGE